MRPVDRFELKNALRPPTRRPRKQTFGCSAISRWAIFRRTHPQQTQASHFVRRTSRSRAQTCPLRRDILRYIAAGMSSLGPDQMAIGRITKQLERRSISAFQNCFGDQRNSGVAEHRQVISTGHPDTLFMWGLQLGEDYTASWRDNAALTACWNISRPGLQGPSASLPSSCRAQPTAPIWCAAAKRCLMASSRSETGGS